MSSALPKETQWPDAGCPSVDEFAAFIEKTVTADARERILGHLDCCENCRTLLAATVRGSQLASGQYGTNALSPRTFPVGEVVGGRYRVLRLISRGGMGEVYEAWDTQLSEPVALKTIVCTRLDNAALYVRIRKEVQLARKVAHPNVCRILEFGVHQQVYRDQRETIPFFTMDLLQGETLAHYLRRHKTIAAAELRPIALQIAHGLAAIHAAGIVHRDLKPENIFLLQMESGGPKAVVMDFGLARNQDGHGSANESSSNSPVGTPSYMAPEQSLGSTPTVAWDIFAFGVILFRAVTGELPFKGNTAVALAVARLREPAPKLSSLVAGVDPVLERVVARCLQREPTHRFGSVVEIGHALAGGAIRPRATQFGFREITLALAAGIAAAAIAWWAFRERQGIDISGAASGVVAVASNGAPGNAPLLQTAESTPLPLPQQAAGGDERDALRLPVNDKPKPVHQKASNRRGWQQVRDSEALTSHFMLPVPSQQPDPKPLPHPVAAPGEDEVVIPSFAGPPRAQSHVEP